MKKCSSCNLPVDQWPIKPYSSMTKTCSVSCALDLVERKKDKAFKSETRAMKVKLLDTDVKFWKAKAQKVFNEFVRLRDAADGCISCDKPASWSGQWHASHWKSRGARPDLAFNEDNVHKSCSVCNNYMSGNVGEYRVRLVGKIGLFKIGILEADTQKPTPMRVEDYKRIHEEYKLKIKQLTKEK